MYKVNILSRLAAESFRLAVRSRVRCEPGHQGLQLVPALHHERGHDGKLPGGVWFIGCECNFVLLQFPELGVSHIWTTGSSMIFVAHSNGTNFFIRSMEGMRPQSMGIADRDQSQLRWIPLVGASASRLRRFTFSVCFSQSLFAG